MDDDNKKSGKNQSGPMFETVPFDDPAAFTPEEVAPDILTPEDAFTSAPPEAVSELPPLYEENKSKYFIIGFAVLFFILLLGGGIWFLLSQRGEPTDPSLADGTKENITLVYWGLWEDKEIFDPLIQKYQEKNPHVTIQYERLDPQDYREKLIARSKNGQGPDIFRFHNTWLPQVQDVAAPLSQDVMSNEEFDKTFYPVHQSDLRVGEFYYGIPLMIDGMVLIYNDTMLKSAGVFAPPTSWVGDLIDIVGDVTVVDKEEELVTAGIAMGLAENVEFFSEILGILLVQNSNYLSKPEGERESATEILRELDQTYAAQSLEVYMNFYENNFWSEDMPNSTTAFIQEKVAMIIAPSWEILTIKAANPELDLKVTTMPKGLNGESVSLASYWVEGVSKTSQHQIEAWKFLRFLASKESQVIMHETQAKTRLFGSAYARVDLADQMLENEYLAPVIQQANDYVSLPLTSRTADNGLNEEIIQYLRDAVNAASNGVDYGSALETAQKGVNQALDRNPVQ